MAATLKLQVDDQTGAGLDKLSKRLRESGAEADKAGSRYDKAMSQLDEKRTGKFAKSLGDVADGYDKSHKAAEKSGTAYKSHAKASDEAAESLDGLGRVASKTQDVLSSRAAAEAQAEYNAELAHTEDLLADIQDRHESIADVQSRGGGSVRQARISGGSQAGEDDTGGEDGGGGLLGAAGKGISTGFSVASTVSTVRLMYQLASAAKVAAGAIMTIGPAAAVIGVTGAEIYAATKGLKALEAAGSQSAKMINDSFRETGRELAGWSKGWIEVIKKDFRDDLGPAIKGFWKDFVIDPLKGLDEDIVSGRAYGGKERERGRRLSEAEAVGVEKWRKSDAKKFAAMDDEDARGMQRDELERDLSEVAGVRKKHNENLELMGSKDPAVFAGKIQELQAELRKRAEARPSDPLTADQQKQMQAAEMRAANAEKGVVGVEAGKSLKISAMPEGAEKEAAFAALKEEVDAKKKAIQEALEAEKKAIRESIVMRKEEREERILQIEVLKDAEINAEKEAAAEAKRIRDQADEDMLDAADRANEAYIRKRERRELVAAIAAERAAMEKAQADKSAADFKEYESGQNQQAVGRSGVMDRMAAGLDPRRIGRKIMDRRAGLVDADFDNRAKDLRDRQAKDLAGAGEGGTDEEFARLQKDHMRERRQLEAQRRREMTKARLGARADVRRGRVSGDEFAAAQGDAINEDIDNAEGRSQIDKAQADAMRGVANERVSNLRTQQAQANFLQNVASTVTQVQAEQEQLRQMVDAANGNFNNQRNRNIRRGGGIQ